MHFPARPLRRPPPSSATSWSAAFFSLEDSPHVKAAIQGMRPFVVGLLTRTAFQRVVTIFGLDRQNLGASLLHDWEKWLIALVTFLILTFTRFSPIWLVLASAALGFTLY